MWQVWLIAAGVFFICEMITVGFLIFWLGIGALLAMITSFITDNVIIQTTVFVISSGLLMFLTKPFVEKFVSKKDNKITTNVYSIIGQNGTVTEEINSKKGTGQIKVGTEIWTALSKDEQIIQENTNVKILEIKGVKAIVTPK